MNDNAVLLPYQRRWVDDQSPFKIGMFARQTGKTFCTTLEIAEDVLAAEATGRRTRWVILSRGERQAREAMNEGVKLHLRALGAVYSELDYDFPLSDGTRVAAQEITTRGGSVITALPANADTARGFSANVFLDEFAFHQESDKIWAALFPVVSKPGLKLRVTSTPNGKGNKFHRLMTGGGYSLKPTAVASGSEPLTRAVHGPRPSGVASQRPISLSCEIVSEGAASVGLCPPTSDAASECIWSKHTVDIYKAVADGLPRDVGLLRSGLDDELIWRQEYECDFEVEAYNQFITSDMANAAQARSLDSLWSTAAASEGAAPVGLCPPAFGAESEWPLVIGVDVARFGDDSSVIFFRRGRDARTIPPQIFQGLDTMQLAAKVVAAANLHNVDAVFVDGGGVGGGVVDALRHLNLDMVIDVNFGSRSNRPDCFNKRAEMWREMKDWLASGCLPTGASLKPLSNAGSFFPSSDGTASAELASENIYTASERTKTADRLVRELTSLQYRFTPDQKIKLESKDDLKSRGLKSPDIADALALTFAFPVAKRDPVKELLEAANPYNPLSIKCGYDPYKTI